MKNPILQILHILPDDKSKIIITKEFSRQVLAFMMAADPKFKEMGQADAFLVYLHENDLVEISYTEISGGRVNFIRKK